MPRFRSRETRKSATRQPGISITASITGMYASKAMCAVPSTPRQVTNVPAESEP